MARKSAASRKHEIPGLTHCHICRAEQEGRVYEFWSGFREKFREDRLYGRKVRLSYTYSDLKPLNVFVCNSCAAALRRQHYRIKFITWGVVALPCLIVMGVVPFLRWDGISAYLCIGFFAVPATVAVACFLYYAWQLLRAVPENPVTDRLVLGRLRQEKEFGKKGYDLLTSSQYSEMFDQ